MNEETTYTTASGKVYVITDMSGRNRTATISAW